MKTILKKNNISMGNYCSILGPLFLSVEKRAFSTNSLHRASSPVVSAPWAPVKVYKNADLEKLKILEQNKGKSGIYMWKNLLTGKLYVGSAQDIKRRLNSYYNINYLKKESSMYINRALLLHGYSSFSLSILEYCDSSLLLEREKWYFELLKPEYNISQEPSSPFLGRIHSEETRAQMSEAKKGQNNPLFGKTHSEDSRLKISEANKGQNHPFFGKAHSEETRLRMSETRKGQNSPLFGKTHSEEAKAKMSEAKGQAVEVLDIETDETSSFSSGCQAGKALGCSEKTVRRYIKSQKLYKGRYLIKR